MTKKEFVTIIAYLTNCYNMEFNEIKSNTWYDILKDLDYENTKMATKKIVETETNGFNINPAVIREAYFNLTNDIQSPSKATTLVMSLLSRYGDVGFRKGYEKLEEENPLALDIVKNIGWCKMCTGKMDAVERQFKSIYTEALKDYIENKTLSKRTQNLIASAKQSMAIAHLEGDCY